MPFNILLIVFIFSILTYSDFDNFINTQGVLLCIRLSHME